MMDAIITYVNGLDPVWQASYNKYAPEPAITKRYRDWGTLKYLLRGIEKCIPSVEKVFLLVSSDSQVPEWVNRENVRVVLHSEIIPEQFLPTFNSTSIEMFMHRIPDLGEQFLYFNDDMFPVLECSEEDFFKDGKAIIGFRHHILASDKYKKRVRNSDRQARKAVGLKAGLTFVRPQHTCSPMLKSESEKVYEFSRDEIYRRVSRLRTTENFNQYLFLDYLYFKGLTLPGEISNKHLSPAVHSSSTIASNIIRPATKMLCINDVHLDEKEFAKYQGAVLSAFEEHFPDKSHFEL